MGVANIVGRPTKLALSDLILPGVLVPWVETLDLLRH